MTSKYGGYEKREFIAGYYDTAYDTRSRQDVDFFVEYSRKADGRTLELGCGTGRVLIPTAIAGYEATGLDLSHYMLQQCREKLFRQPEDVQQRIRLIEGNMTDFHTTEQYSLVTIPFRPFQHLITPEEQKACLNCSNHHLITAGLLILDIFHPYPPRLVPDPRYMKETEDLPETALPDGRHLRRTSRTAAFHREQQYNDIEIIYYITHPDGRQERLVQAFPFRYFFRYEVEYLLELCGFRMVDLFGNYDRSPLSNDSPEMIFVAQKR
jgi:SAM-dependent methyltransferase